MKKIMVGLGIMIWLAACAEIFDEDFTGHPVLLLYPADSTETSDTSIRLSWAPVEKASDYQLQVAQPRFDSLARMVKDTVTRVDSFVLSALEKGKSYQWRVRAIGNNFVTPYSNSRTFTIRR